MCFKFGGRNIFRQIRHGLSKIFLKQNRVISQISLFIPVVVGVTSFPPGPNPPILKHYKCFKTVWQIIIARSNGTFTMI